MKKVLSILLLVAGLVNATTVEAARTRGAAKTKAAATKTKKKAAPKTPVRRSTRKSTVASTAASTPATPAKSDEFAKAQAIAEKVIEANKAKLEKIGKAAKKLSDKERKDRINALTEKAQAVKADKALKAALDKKKAANAKFGTGLAFEGDEEGLKARNELITKLATEAKKAKRSTVKGAFKQTAGWVKEHKAVSATVVLSIVALGVAAANKGVVCEKAANAIAWMKANKGKAIAAIAVLMTVGTGAYVWSNWDKDLKVKVEKDGETVEEAAGFFAKLGDASKTAFVENTKAGFGKVKAGFKLANESKGTRVVAATAGATTVATAAVLYDLTRENSVLKKAATAVYNKVVSVKA